MLSIFLPGLPTWGGNLGPKVHPRGVFFGTHFYTLKNSGQDLSNEGSNFILSSLEVGHWLHNGENDSYIRQSQLWNQRICQTKTAKFFLWNWLVILMPCNSLTNFEFEEEEFCCNLAKRHPYLRWPWERTIDSIRWCYKNQIGIKKPRPFGPVCLLSCF